MSISYSSIGTFEFLQMQGPQIPLLASAVEIIDRPGTDGVASRVDALKAEEITIYTVEGVVNLATAQNKADDYAALKGELVTVIDDLGRSVQEVLVVDVRVISTPQKLALSVPTGIGYVVRAIWLLKPTKA